MLNQMILVGRITKSPALEENKDKINFSEITLAVPRSYKNVNGEYETDFITCLLYKGIAENTCEYCKKGDLVGIKGRLQTIDNKLVVIAEKVTFLSSRKVEENGE